MIGEGLQRKQKLILMCGSSPQLPPDEVCVLRQQQLVRRTGGMMVLLLLLQLHLVACVSLPAPSNVSIFSFNMEHWLSFSAGPRTPPEAHFTVQVLGSRRSEWRPVAGCSQLKAQQTCNLTSHFTDVFDHYSARVRAVGANQTSQWAVSKRFQPLSDTVLGPPDVSVSGCGNCLILHVRNPPDDLLQHNKLKDVYWELNLNVRRTRDGSEFRLNLPYKQESVITHLQPGVEYCVTVSVALVFNQNGLLSERQCSFTSPPAPRCSQFVLLGLFGVFSLTVCFFVGRIIRTQVKTSGVHCLSIRSDPYSCLMKTPLTEETLSSS